MVDAARLVLLVLPFSLLCGCRQVGLTEFQPDIPRGGRAALIEVVNANIALVASDSGGIFRTTDGGGHWKHVDTFPSIGVSDLRFIANTHPPVVIATTSPDGFVDVAQNRGGIWRSPDAGLTWTHADLTNLCAPGVRTGNGIGFMPNTPFVYVATDCGLLFSIDFGANWTSVLFNQPVRSVVAHSGSIVDICTPGGHLRQLAGGRWLPDSASGLRPDCAGPHSLAISPLEPNVLFATAGSTILESDTAGAQWSDLLSQPFSERPKWVKTQFLNSSQFDLYSSGQRQTCNGLATAQRCSTSWNRVPTTSFNHDINDIAFPPSGNCPQLIALDFGILKADALGTTACSDGSQWQLTGGGAGGYDALQIYAVIGQVNRQERYTHLYVGTQDNNILFNNDARTSGWTVPIGSEGAGLDTPHFAPQIDPAFLGVTGTRCSPCSDFYFPRTASGGWGIQQGWTVDPPGSGEVPALVEPKVYVQFKGNELFMTTSMGASPWTKVATVTFPRIITQPQVAGPASDPTVYFPVIQSPGQIRLAKIRGIRSSTGAPQTGTVVNCIGDGCQPAVGAGLVNLPFICFPLPCTSVFAVDPSDANHVIVADSGTSHMKVSTNGGATWTVDRQLTADVTMNGKLAFGPVSIYFDRADTRRIFVGTAESGLIVSVDGGNTWTTIVDSQKLTTITSVFFDPPNNYAYVATFSRGLWKLNMDSTGYRDVLTYIGPNIGLVMDKAIVGATFFNNSHTPPLPIANALINFKIGNSSIACEALTDVNGRSQCTIGPVDLLPGFYMLNTRFAGDAQYAPVSITSSFGVRSRPHK